jgi:hypothetical protein
MKRSVSLLVLLALAACDGGGAGEPSVAPPKGAVLLFELSGRAVHTFTCDGTQWVIETQGDEALLEPGGRRVGSVASSAYSTTWKTDDGSSLTAQTAARDDSSLAGENPAIRYDVVSQQGSRFAAVRSVRRVSTRGVAPGLRDCSQRGAQRRTDFSAVYQYYGIGQQK